MSFIKTSLYSAIGTSISLLTRLITNKIVAVYLGTNGMFLLGQLKDFLKLTSNGSNLGTSDGLIKYIAQYKDQKEQLSNYLSSGFKIHLFASVFVAIMTFLFRDFLSEKLFKDVHYASFFIILAFSLITIAFHSFILTILNGTKRIKQYVIITSISTIINAIVLILLVINFQLEGALYGFALGQIISFIVSFTVIKMDNTITFNQFLKPLKKIHLKNLSQFSLMALVSPIFLISATFFVRSFVSEEFGKEYAGSWEGMWRLSAMYLLFITTTLKFYLLPTFSKLEGSQLKSEVFKVWKYVLPIVSITIIAIYLLKDFLITTLFSQEFLLIGTLIGFHLLGDLVKIHCWILGNLLKAKANAKAFIFFQFEWAFAFIMLSILFSKYYGFKGIAIAYMCSYIIHFLVMNIYFRKLLWLKK